MKAYAMIFSVALAALLFAGPAAADREMSTERGVYPEVRGYFPESDRSDAMNADVGQTIGLSRENGGNHSARGNSESGFGVVDQGVQWTIQQSKEIGLGW